MTATDQDRDMQEKILRSLSDIDAPVINDRGHHVVQWWVECVDMKFPCSSLSLALSLTKKLLIEGKEIVQLTPAKQPKGTVQ